MIANLKSCIICSLLLIFGGIVVVGCRIPGYPGGNSLQGQAENVLKKGDPTRLPLSVVPTWTSTPIPAPVITATSTPISGTDTVSESTPLSYNLTLIPGKGDLTVTLPQTITEASTTKLPQKQNDIAWVALNDSHIFWTTTTESGAIFRFPLHGVNTASRIEKIVSTQFEQGTLNFYNQFLVNNNWLIYIDAAQQAEATPWRLRVFNLKTGVTQTILENLDMSWSVPDITFDDDRVAWALVDSSQKTAKCTQTVLALYNLKSQQQRELDRTCIDNNYIWGIPALSANSIVAEHTTPNLKNDIYLYDLTTDRIKPLTNNGHSSMPTFVYPWVAWKDSARYEYAPQTILYNVASGQQKAIGLGLTLDRPSLTTDHWLYWNNQATSTNPVYAYDIAQGSIHLLAQQSSRKELIGPVAIYGNTIAWWRLVLDERDIPNGGFLEWKSLP